jgi:hypothetical protein
VGKAAPKASLSDGLTTQERSALDVAADLAWRVLAARQDFSAYAELCVTDQYGRPVRQGMVHRTWHGHIWWCWLHGLHPSICAPWGLGKTTSTVVELTPWMHGRSHSLRACVVCNIDTNAKLRVAAQSRVITERPQTRLVFPDLRIKGGKQHSDFAYSIEGSSGGKVDPSLRAWGVFGSGTGSRVDLLLLDDIVDMGNAVKNPTLRQKVIDTCDSVWFPRLEPPCSECGGSGVEGGLAAALEGTGVSCRLCSGTGGGRSIGIGTMWHAQDYWHDRLQRPGYVSLVQRVDKLKTGYETRVFGVPKGLRYPSLEELVLWGNPTADPVRLLSVLQRENEERRAASMQARAEIDASGGQSKPAARELAAGVDPVSLFG